MTTKTKTEVQCCQDLSVRVARAEMERDAAKASADLERKWSGTIAEAYSRQELRTAEVREKLEKANLALVAKGNEEFRARQLNEALKQELAERISRPLYKYGDQQTVDLDPGIDWSFFLFGTMLLSGLGAWIFGAVKLIEYLVGRFA